MITFYDCVTAPSPRRARILLAEKEVEHRSVMVDLAGGEQFTEAFREINPRCTVPVLQLGDGALLCDNAAIAAYLEAAFPEPALMGRTPLEKAEIASWNWRLEFDGLVAIAEYLRNASPAMAHRALPGPVDYEQIPELAQRGQARLKRFVEELESHLAGRDFIATGAFSLADITAVVMIDFARAAKVRPGEQHPNLLRWRAAMGQRAAMGL